MANYGRDPAKEVQLPIRIPLLGLLNQREDNPRRGSRLVNAYVEKGEDGQIYVVKRPGLRVLYSLEGYGRGMYETASIFAEAATGGSEAVAYIDGTEVFSFGATADLPEDTNYYWVEPVADSLSSVAYFIHNKQRAWIYQGGTLSLVPFETASFQILGDTTNTSTSISTATTSGITEYSTVSGAGIPAGAFVESIDGTTSFTISAPATATASAIVLVFGSGGPSANPPATRPDGTPAPITDVLTGGIVDLNTATHLFDYRAVISTSDVLAPTSWNPLSRIYAYARQDTPIAIASQLSYVIAFKSTSTEFFQDEGLSPGSPLARVEGLRLDVGCYRDRTVCDLDGTLYWVSNTVAGRKSVWRMRDARPADIATPAVRRVLEGSDPEWAIVFSLAGHDFYLITDSVAGYTMVYDAASDYWSYWKALGENYFPFVAASYANGAIRLQHESNGKIYVIDPSYFDDIGDPYEMDIYLPEFDAGMRQSKYLTRMRVIADQVRYSYLKVRVSDENMTHGTWSNFRIFNLWEANPHLEQCGSFYKRSFHFQHAEKTACRLQAIELEIHPGVL